MVAPIQDQNHLQEAAQTLMDMIDIMDPEDDYLNIVSAEDSIQKTHQRREKQIDELQSSLKALTKALEAARISSTRPATVPSADQHIEKVNDLDAESLSLMKAISDVEGALAGKVADLSALKEKARELKASDAAEEHQQQLDGTALRLRMFKEMGFEPCLDKKGKLVKMIIRSQSGDIHTVDFDGGRSSFQQCKLLWELAAS